MRDREFVRLVIFLNAMRGPRHGKVESSSITERGNSLKAEARDRAPRSRFSWR